MEETNSSRNNNGNKSKSSNEYNSKNSHGNSGKNSHGNSGKNSHGNSGKNSHGNSGKNSHGNSSKSNNGNSSKNNNGNNSKSSNLNNGTNGNGNNRKSNSEDSNKRTRKKNREATVINRADYTNGREIAYQNKDIVSKLLAEYFKGKTFRVYGLDIPEVKAVLPTNIPVVRANELRVDNLFELADDTVALVDYESEYKKEDKVKYLNYLTGIANRYQKEKKDCPTLRMIVIYTGDIERKQVSEEYNIGAVRVRVESAFLSELDSERLFRDLKEKVEKKELLNDEELMEFIILPLSYRKKEEKEEKIWESVNLAAQIQDKSQQLFTLAGILAFTDKVIDMKTANKIRRMIGMTKVGWIIEQEKQQIIAKAEEEKQQAIAKVEVEKQQELAEAEKEKQQALARAEAEKRQAERESVVKMLRKNYPIEEIAFIVSGFTCDDIEAVRREIAQNE